LTVNVCLLHFILRDLKVVRRGGWKPPGLLQGWSDVQRDPYRG